MNIIEKLAASNNLLVDTCMAGLTVAIGGLVWKPQYMEYHGEQNGLDVYAVVLNRATCPRWYWPKYIYRNRDTITQIVVAEKDFANYGAYSWWSRCLLRNPNERFQSKLVGHGDTLEAAISLLNRRRKLFVIRKLTDAA
jgi:hypothetical protein